MDLPQENAGKDSPTYTMGSVTPTKGPSFLRDWSGPHENDDVSPDDIMSNPIVGEPDQLGRAMDEMDKQRIAASVYSSGANRGYGQQHPGGAPAGFYGGPPQNSAYGPVYYAVNQSQQLTNDYEILKRLNQSQRAAYDALNGFFGDARKRRAFDPTTQSLNGFLSQEPLVEGNVTAIADCLESLGRPKSWCSNPRLYYLMNKMGRLDLFPKILDAEITDLWLPLHKRLVRKWMHDTDTRTFIKYQEFILDENIPVSLQGRHFTLDNMDQLDLRRIMFLGAGGFGEVHSVQNRGDGQVYACKTMARPVRFDAHAEMMRNFKREIMGMRRVHHRHCVDLIASCTDTDSVTILSHPVADSGDLSTFLDANLNLDQLKVLRHSVGCITSALTYLHSLNIRHDDLKPNNILIHGTNVLLTDFGFCLDASDTGVTTTAGPPTHSTRRYSAPEVFNHSPRSRLTDIWSLGCVLADIVSRLLGHKLEEMRTFWSLHGSRIDSYAENPVATSGWLTHIQSSPGGWTSPWRTKIWLVSFIKLVLLEKERLKRPTAQEILTRLGSLLTTVPDMNRYGDLEPYWLGACCAPPTDHARVEPFWCQAPFQPAVDILNIDNHFETIIIALDLSIVASKTQYDRKLDIKTLLCGENDLKILQGVASDLDLQILSDPAFAHCEFPDPVLLSLPFEAYARSLYLYPSNTGVVRTRSLDLRYPNDFVDSFDCYFFTAVLDSGTSSPGVVVPFIAMCFEPNLPSGSPGIYYQPRSPGD